MFSSIRKRLNVTNVALALALVFAMTGGAYAAKRVLITSKSQISPKVLKELQGKAGPAGTQGPAGPAGPAGAAGAKGDSGSPGAKGEKGDTGEKGEKGEKGVNGSAGTTGPKGATGLEGSEGPPGAKGLTGTTGPEGSPWTAGGTLPSGKTETGVWGAAGVAVNVFGGVFKAVVSPISFTIPLKEALASSKVHIFKVGKKGTGAGSGCPTGSEAAKPEAEPGNLCIFMSSEENVEEAAAFSMASAFEEGAGKTGSLIAVAPASEANSLDVQGSWAVTAK
jgi:hypothetical protein